MANGILRFNTLQCHLAVRVTDINYLFLSPDGTLSIYHRHQPTIPSYTLNAISPKVLLDQINQLPEQFKRFAYWSSGDGDSYGYIYSPNVTSVIRCEERITINFSNISYSLRIFPADNAAKLAQAILAGM